MSTEENKALIRRYVAEAWNQKKVDTIDAVYADEFTLNTEPYTPAKYKEQLRGYLEDVPDLYHSIDDIIAEGDRVAYRWTMRGNNQATGKPEAGRGITFMRIVDGKIVEDWFNSNDLGEDG